MIRIKCRGYEGDLERLYSDVIRVPSICKDILKVATYEIEIGVSDDESVTLRNVRDGEIEILNA